MSDDFINFVEIAVEEVMYQSGSAKGMGVKDNPNYTSHGLEMIDVPCQGSYEITVKFSK